ncbi:efflux RND transporter permease subunit [Carboxydochorda subterranea]|uniref:Efflux RND transporter permease subunit n=1 Tax=Carboxydichorda subterranea TaxID=3109565 RepID=A0ABZ1BX53_9FIRM|nr:efflux RND transporter permease subunit [Limnochorda sp. L945t]WRP17381.1 efflux RND transporter permease subunit [Limnochorda sp. L945t]
MERFVEQAIRRPVLVSMLVLAVIVVGSTAVTRMGLDLLPDIEVPVVAVVTVYPGAGPDAVEQQVTNPIEQALTLVPGISRTTSLSLENVSLVVAEFGWGTHVPLAVQDVDEALQRIRLTLPSDTQPPAVLRFDPTQMPMAMYALTAARDAPAGAAELPKLTQVAREVVVPLLDRVEGVGRVVVSGGTTDEVQVRYDPGALSEAGLSAAQLVQLLTYQNVEVPVGAITEGGRRLQVRAGAPLRSVEQLRELPVAIQRPGEGAPGLLPRLVHLGDVASVELVHRPPEGFARIDGRPSLLIAVQKEAGYNTVVVARRIAGALASARHALEGWELVPVFQQAEFIVRSIRSVTQSGIIGGVLAVAVLYLFLLDILSTLTIALAIPISIVATVAFMFLDGMTLNLMSLGGLGLGIGMLVDNSIVVLESIFRHARAGEPPGVAARRGAAEVGLAISASTFTTVVVFLPVVFVGGLAGRIFRQLALTVSFSLLASLAVSLTVVPMMAARLGLASNGSLAAAVSQLAARRRGRHWFGPVRDAYERLLRWSLRHRTALWGAVALILAAAVAAYGQLDVELLTPVDAGLLGVTVRMPGATPLERTDEVARRVEQAVARVPGVAAVATQGGSAGTGDLLSVMGGESANAANLYVLLAPRSTGRHRASEIARAVRQAVSGVLHDVPGAQGTVTDTPTLGLVGELLARRVTLQVTGRDPSTLQRVASEVAARLRQVPGFVNVSTSLDERAPALLLRVDPGRALFGGLVAGQVGGALRQAVTGAPAGKLVLADGRQLPVVVRAEPGSVNSLEGLMRYPVSGLALPGAKPPQVQVGRVTSPENVLQEPAIQHRDGRRVVVVTAELQGVQLGEAGRRALAAIRDVTVPAAHDVILAGVHELMGEAFADLWLALALAVVLVYMVMAAQFESLLDPLIIMITVPLGLAGGVLALWLTGHQVGITSILGGVVLAGIAVNNGIVLIDYVNQVAGRVASFEEAVVQASVVRLRPVLMTALTTIFGLVPLTLGWGEAAELEVPLAVTVVGGMVLATGLTLLVVPALKLSLHGVKLSHRVPASALPAQPGWLAPAVAGAALMTLLAASSARAAAPPADAWKLQGGAVGLGATYCGSSQEEARDGGICGGWAGGLVEASRIEAGGAVSAADLQVALGIERGPEGPTWMPQVGGRMVRSRALGLLGYSSTMGSVWLQGRLPRVAPSTVEAMGRFTGSVAAGNVMLGATVQGTTTGFREQALLLDASGMALWLDDPGPGWGGRAMGRFRFNRTWSVAASAGWHKRPDPPNNAAPGGANVVDTPLDGPRMGAGVEWRGFPWAAIQAGGGARYSEALQYWVMQLSAGVTLNVARTLSASVDVIADVGASDAPPGVRHAPVAATVMLQGGTSTGPVVAVGLRTPPVPAGSDAVASSSPLALSPDILATLTLPVSWEMAGRPVRQVRLLAAWQAAERKAELSAAFPF